MNFGQQLDKLFNDIDKLLRNGTSLPDSVKNPLRKALEYTVIADNNYKEYELGFIDSSKKPVKSGYYDDPVNHPEGGGTCDNCNEEVMPGDGYEGGFDSSTEIALEALAEVFRLNENDVTSSQFKRSFAEFLNMEDEDELYDALYNICDMAFEGKPYLCPDCAKELIKEAAVEWAHNNYEF